MTIFFDARFISANRADGISRFSINLLGELSRILPVTAIVSHAHQVDVLPPSVEHIFESPADSIRELGFARRMNRRRASVVFSPMQTTGGLGRKFKLVLTIHDLIYYSHSAPPPRFSAAVRLIWRLYHLSYWPQRVLLRQAEALVTVSEASKRAIEKARLYAGPIHVIANAVAPEIAAPTPTNQALTRPFKVVYAGSFMGYKDVETLVRGCSSSTNEIELHLVSPIEQPRRDELQRVADESNTRVVFHDGMSDSDYAALLDQSALMVTASRAEGFCIPVLEAFSRSVPAVCSDLEVLREVAGDGAEFFEPGNPEALAQAVTRALERRDELAWRARQRAQDFSWAKSAQKLKDLLESLDA